MQIDEKEYEQLKKQSELYKSGDEIWSWTKFKKEWISRVFLAWIVIIVISAFIIFLKIPVANNILIFIGGATFIFMLEKPLGKVISNAEIKAGAQANIDTNIAKIIEAVKGK